MISCVRLVLFIFQKNLRKILSDCVRYVNFCGLAFRLKKIANSENVGLIELREKPARRKESYRFTWSTLVFKYNE